MRDLEPSSAHHVFRDRSPYSATLHTKFSGADHQPYHRRFSPPHQQEQIRVQLSFVSGDPVAAADCEEIRQRKGACDRVWLVPNPAIRNLIRGGQDPPGLFVHADGQARYGMQTMNQSLIEPLIQRGISHNEDAVGRSPVPEEIITMLQRLSRPLWRAGVIRNGNGIEWSGQTAGVWLNPGNSPLTPMEDVIAQAEEKNITATLVKPKTKSSALSSISFGGGVKDRILSYSRGSLPR